MAICVRLRNYYDLWYHGYVSVGIQDDMFLVMFDTGANEIWVPCHLFPGAAAVDKYIGANSLTHNPGPSNLFLIYF